MLDVRRKIQNGVQQLPFIDVGDEPDRVHQVYEDAHRLLGFFKAYVAMVDEQVVEWCYTEDEQGRKRSVEFGPDGDRQVLYAKPESRTKVDRQAYPTLMAELLDACDGDYGELAKCLSSDAFGLTAIRSRLGDCADRFTVTTTTDKPKVKKAPKRVKAIGGAS